MLDLDRYLRNEDLRAALEARARRERAETVHRLLRAALRFPLPALCARHTTVRACPES